MSADLDALLALARRAFDQPDDAEGVHALMALYARDDAETLAAAIALLNDADPVARGLGASILGQMGSGTEPGEWEALDAAAILDDAAFDAADLAGEDDSEDGSEDDSEDGDEDGDEDEADDEDLPPPVFAEARAEALLARYAVEPEARVLGEIGGALGHLGWTAAVPALVARAAHPEAAVRYGVVLGLTGQDDPAAVAALVTLSADPDGEVRNWATFALGSQLELDTDGVRAALRARLHDADAEVRSEALLGLARRLDPTVVPAVVQALGGTQGTASAAVEAAIELGHPALHPALLALRDRADAEHTPHFRVQLDEAIARCDPDAEI